MNYTKIMASDARELAIKKRVEKEAKAHDYFLAMIYEEIMREANEGNLSAQVPVLRVSQTTINRIKQTLQREGYTLNFTDCGRLLIDWKEAY